MNVRYFHAWIYRRARREGEKVYRCGSIHPFKSDDVTIKRCADPLDVERGGRKTADVVHVPNARPLCHSQWSGGWTRRHPRPPLLPYVRQHHVVVNRSGRIERERCCLDASVRWLLMFPPFWTSTLVKYRERERTCLSLYNPERFPSHHVRVIPRQPKIGLFFFPSFVQNYTVGARGMAFIQVFPYNNKSILFIGTRNEIDHSNILPCKHANHLLHHNTKLEQPHVFPSRFFIAYHSSTSKSKL